jgi:hypothetical protein
LDQLGLLASLDALVDVATLDEEPDPSPTAAAAEARRPDGRRRWGHGILQRRLKCGDDAGLYRDALSFFHVARPVHEHPRSLFVDAHPIQSGGRRRRRQRPPTNRRRQATNSGGLQESDAGPPQQAAGRRANVPVAVDG